jgi:hypothetical protein
MNRRRLLQLGLGAAVALTVAGGGLALLQPGVRAGRLTPTGRALFAAVARAVLDGSLPATQPAQAAAIDRVVERVDATIAGFPPSVRKELSDLIALMSVAPGRFALTGLGESWADASVGDVQAALLALRTSTLTLRQQAYHALRDLTAAAYCSDPNVWPQLGYPGPRALG